MSKNPLIRDQDENGDIECTLANATFALAAIQHALESECEPVTLPWDAAQGHIMALQSVIIALNTSMSRVEQLTRGSITTPLTEVKA